MQPDEHGSQKGTGQEKGQASISVIAWAVLVALDTFFTHASEKWTQSRGVGESQRCQRAVGWLSFIFISIFRSLRVSPSRRLCVKPFFNHVRKSERLTPDPTKKRWLVPFNGLTLLVPFNAFSCAQEREVAKDVWRKMIGGIRCCHFSPHMFRHSPTSTSSPRTRKALCP